MLLMTDPESLVGRAVQENMTTFGLNEDAPTRFFPLKSNVPDNVLFFISIALQAVVPLLVTIEGTAST
jgi:hypothetical protein